MGSDKKQELLGIKLKNAILIGKKTSKTTPSPNWKLGFHNSSSLDPNFTMNPSVSARKIGANLWEVQPHFNCNKNDADSGGGGGGGGRSHDSRRRRHHGYRKEGFEFSDQLDEEHRNNDPQPEGGGDGDGNLKHHRRRRHHSHDKEMLKFSDQLDEEASDSDQQPPEFETNLRRNIRELPSLRDVPVGKYDQNLHHVSSASCSSMQVTPYASTVTPTRYAVNPSTHLLKVLNRIWNLEEQHSSNVALIKILKRDLDISRAQIKTLIEERKRDQQELNELKKSTHNQKKKSTKDEIWDMKSSFLREQKARILLESLCDEFAKGIRDYDKKFRFLQQNGSKNDRITSKNEPDRLVLHVSEAWLDERSQMKCDLFEKTSISDHLCCEIETFLDAKKKQSRGSGVENREEDGSCGVVAEPSSKPTSRMTDQGPGAAEPSSKPMSRMADQGPGATEPCLRSMSRMSDRGPGGAEPSSSRAREGPKANTLMAKLLEARLESQFSKSRTVRR